MGQPKMISVFLMETDDGPVLFETGPHSCMKYLEKGLAEYGYKKEDVKHLFLTHIHLDHAGGAWDFAKHGAKVYVHPLGYKHLVDPSRLVASATKLYKDKMDLLWGKFMPTPAENLVIAEHGQVFEIGGKTIKTLHSPGHANHHAAYATAEGIVCGDVAGICIATGPPIPPCPPPDIDFDIWRKSIDTLLAENPDTLHIAHFGSHENGVQHLKNLRIELDALDEYSYSLFQKMPDKKEAYTEFNQWVRARMLKVCPSKKIADYYAISMPTRMQLSGVFRYYKKREETEKEVF